LDDLQPQQYRIVLGRALAQRLGVEVGDSLALLVPRMTDGNSASFAPELRSYSVSGIFELGVLDHDSVRAFIHLDDARELAGAVKRVDGLRVETNDIFAAPELVRRWRIRVVLMSWKCGTGRNRMRVTSGQSGWRKR
jgi:lipoprotein-releasing system permease protein